MFNHRKTKADPDYLVDESRRLRTQLAVTGAKLEVFCQQLLIEIARESSNGNGPGTSGTGGSGGPVDNPP